MVFLLFLLVVFSGSAPAEKGKVVYDNNSNQCVVIHLNFGYCCGFLTLRSRHRKALQSASFRTAASWRQR